MATVYPYQDGTAFTDSGLGDAGRWQAAIMSPVTGAAETVTIESYGVVDGQGRIVSVLPSAARTVDQTSAALYSRGAAGLIATMVVTADPASASVTLSIQAYDVPSATWVNLLTSAAITGTGTTRLTVSPQVATVANVSLNGVIPDTVRIFVDASNTDSFTYSVGLDWTP